MMEGEDYREITRRALKDWPDNSLFNIENYGYLLESYVYNLDDNPRYVNDISYNRFNPDGTPEKSVFVEAKDGLYKRSVVLWDTDSQERVDGYLSSTVLTMGLDLETIDPNFSLDKVKVYDRKTKDPRIHPGIDSYYFDLDIKETLDHCTVKYPIEKQGDIDQSLIVVDNDMSVAYYEDLGIYRLYHKGQNYAEAEIRVLPNCLVEINYFDDVVTVCYFGGDAESFYNKEETESPIDCLSNCSFRVLEYPNESIKYTYDKDCLIRDVSYSSENNTEGIKLSSFGKNKKSISRVETYFNDSEYYKHMTSYQRSEYASLYPTGVTLNNENFIYKFWKLWSYDKAEFDVSGKMSIFSRYIYYIEDDALEDLINDMNMYPEDPILL